MRPSDRKVPANDTDAFISLCDRNDQAHLEAINEAFVAAMLRQVRRGKEKVAFGVSIDMTPPISAVRIHANETQSCCGSPAAMCALASG